MGNDDLCRRLPQGGRKMVCSVWVQLAACGVAVAAPRLLNDAGSKSDCVALCDGTMVSNELERMWK